jgi:phage-related protein
MKPVRFVGSAKDDLSAFPKPARIRAGHELFMVQVGREPDDWKPMSTVGPGACEMKTSQPDLDLARERYSDARDHAKGTSRG